MKKVLLALACSAFALSATTITFGSDLVNESNSLTGTNVHLSVIPAPFAPEAPGSLWVSYADTIGTNPGNTATPNSTVTPKASFYEDLTTTNGIWGSVTVWADDTTAVYFGPKGGPFVLLIAPNFATDAHCAAGPVGCEPGEGGTAFFSATTPGTYQLKFDVFQVAAYSYGVMYRGTYSDTPEPATMAFAGLGLMALGLYARRNR